MLIEELHKYYEIRAELHAAKERYVSGALGKCNGTDRSGKVELR